MVGCFIIVVTPRYDQPLSAEGANYKGPQYYLERPCWTATACENHASSTYGDLDRRPNLDIWI
jgi:hypothetical protein